MERAVALLDKHGWHVMVQTVNGTDVHAAVGAFEHAAAANPAPLRDRRNRLDENMLSDGQVRILVGSNWPAASLDPRDAVEDVVAAPGDLRNAIDAYTSHAAYASYDEQRKGTLARGMLADIVILSNDIFEPRPEALRETAVTVTIFDGKIVYQRPPAVSSND
jgi:imidazolonepropionase-like amidohydrolase